MVFGQQKVSDHMNAPANLICESDLIPDLTSLFLPLLAVGSKGIPYYKSMNADQPSKTKEHCQNIVCTVKTCVPV